MVEPHATNRYTKLLPALIAGHVGQAGEIHILVLMRGTSDGFLKLKSLTPIRRYPNATNPYIA